MSEKTSFSNTEVVTQRLLDTFNVLMLRYFPGVNIENHWERGVCNENYSITYSKLDCNYDNSITLKLLSTGNTFGQNIVRVETLVPSDKLNDDDKVTLIYLKPSRTLRFEVTINTFKTYKTQIRLIQHILLATMYGRRLDI